MIMPQTTGFQQQPNFICCRCSNCGQARSWRLEAESTILSSSEVCGLPNLASQTHLWCRASMKSGHSVHFWFGQNWFKWRVDRLARLLVQRTLKILHAQPVASGLLVWDCMLYSFPQDEALSSWAAHQIGRGSWIVGRIVPLSTCYHHRALHLKIPFSITEARYALWRAVGRSVEDNSLPAKLLDIWLSLVSASV